MRAAFPLIISACITSGAMAQTNIEETNKWCWGENVGWMNWHDADGGTAAAFVGGSYMTGFIWGENIGWVNLGDGSPADGVSYANTDGTDFGVNIAPDGSLTGLAWSENFGWINFAGGAAATPANPARYDIPAGRLRGYAWGENLGWISFDDATRFVGVTPPLCLADFNQDGGIDGSDVGAFFEAWEAGDASADVNADGGVDGSDVSTFFERWEAGC